MKQNATRDAIIAYLHKHPSATLRAIQSACGISSPSVVAFHIKRIKSTAAECPICKGSGRLPEPNTIERDRATERKRMARTLREAGYSIRQIQDFVGWKSPRSVVEAIDGTSK